MSNFIMTDNAETKSFSSRQYNLLDLDTIIRFSLSFADERKLVSLKITSTNSTFDPNAGVVYSGREALDVWDKIRDTFDYDVDWEVIDWMTDAWKEGDILLKSRED